MDLTTLPLLPPTLTVLDCYRNQLTTLLTLLPPALIELWYSSNKLTTLPTLPPALIELWCSSNKLTTPPPHPSTELWRSDSPYTSIFEQLITHDIAENVYRIRLYHASIIKGYARSTIALRDTFGEKYNGVLRDDCLNMIGSYLSGQSGTLAMQIAALRTALI